jgi:hypothetical protein
MGGALGAGVLALLQHRATGFAWADVSSALVLGGGIGAMLGAAGLPVLGWLCFRHVSLGRALLVTGAGALAGATMGLAIGSSALVGAGLGFLGASVLLRFSRAV